jgi:RsiW-degrading membrane proteinase PrsW (M82 family)
VQIILLAFAPGVFLCLYIYLRDRYDRENPLSVLRTFLWGMAAVLPALVAEWMLFNPRLTVGYDSLGEAFACFAVIGPVEEFCKFAPVWFFVYFTSEFSHPKDGLVFSSASAMGFASLENLLYLRYHGIDAFAVRALLSVPGHLFFSGIWGYQLGAAKGSPDQSRRVWTALLAASALHGLYDFLLRGKTHQAALTVPLMAALAFLFFRELDVLEHSPVRVEPETVVNCPSCGAPTGTAVDLCQHCGVMLPPAGVDETGRS